MTTRRSFLIGSASLAASGLLTKTIRAQDTTPPPPGVSAAPPKPPALPPEKVQATVAQSHRNLAAGRALVEETPLLVNACWDQGGGDFETPLQAAAHTGRRAIAEYLLSQNARLDLYAAGMLGHLDFVRAALGTDVITAAAVPGPHGFTLLHCARVGGESAKPVYDWLIAQGVPTVFQRPLPFVWPANATP